MLSGSKYLLDFLVGFLDKKPQTLLIPIYSTTVLYDKFNFYSYVPYYMIHNYKN